MGETIKAQYFPIMQFQREEKKNYKTALKILMAPNLLSFDNINVFVDHYSWK